MRYPIKGLAYDYRDLYLTFNDNVFNLIGLIQENYSKNELIAKRKYIEITIQYHISKLDPDKTDGLLLIGIMMANLALIITLKSEESIDSLDNDIDYVKELTSAFDNRNFDRCQTLLITLAYIINKTRISPLKRVLAGIASHHAIDHLFKLIVTWYKWNR
jgi:hypothetical protein